LRKAIGTSGLMTIAFGLRPAKRRKQKSH